MKHIHRQESQQTDGEAQEEGKPLGTQLPQERVPEQSQENGNHTGINAQ